LLDIETVWNAVLFLFSKLNDEAYLCGDAEVGNDVEAHSLEEGVTRDLLLVASVHREVFALDRRDLHDVADV
jgi:hypothetical protein